MARRVTMRPRFEIVLKSVDGDCLKRLESLLAAEDSPYCGQVLQKHAYIQLPPLQRSLLSPYLNLDIVEREDTCYLGGRFTPHPHVWTGFMAIYGVLAMVGVGGLIYGLAQMTVKETPWALGALPASLILMAFVYGASLIGQGLSSDEMYRMRAYIECLVWKKEFEKGRSYLPDTAADTDQPNRPVR